MIAPGAGPRRPSSAPLLLLARPTRPALSLVG